MALLTMALLTMAHIAHAAILTMALLNMALLTMAHVAHAAAALAQQDLEGAPRVRVGVRVRVSLEGAPAYNTSVLGHGVSTPEQASPAPEGAQGGP